jgi:hypothetical protein
MIATEELYTGKVVESLYEVSPNGKYVLKCLKISPEQAMKNLKLWATLSTDEWLKLIK